MKKNWKLQAAAPILALVGAAVIAGIILAATGNDPGDVLQVIVDDGFETRRVVDTLNRAAPYYIAGVAVAIGFKMTLFNIGVEGQYRLAALVAAWAGASVNLPAPLHVLFILMVAVITGAAWAAIPGLLRATRGVHEVISSIMLNSIALGLGAFLLHRWFRAPAGEYPGAVGTEVLPTPGRLPLLNGLVEKLGVDLPPGTRLQSYIFIALIIGVAYHLVISRTRFGFDLRASGSNPEAAEASGVDPKRMVVVTMVLSGAVAGLIGLNNVMSNVGDQARYTDVSVVGGLGFTGIAIALLGRNHPVGIALGALLWAFMDALQTPLSSAQLPKQITAILQGVAVLSVVIAYEVVRRIEQRQQASSLRRDSEPPPASEVAPA
ncbi:MAG: ABC transporter permease [Acidimicrobiales bacterium]|nr:ABC transporter permease [Acidimicrobiales bacterium]